MCIFKNKKRDFAVLLDSGSKTKKIADIINNSKMKAVPSNFNRRNINNASHYDVLLVRAANGYHYTLASVSEALEIEVSKVYLLSDSFADVKKELNNFIDVNNLKKPSPRSFTVEIETTVTDLEISLRPTKKLNTYYLGVDNAYPVTVYETFAKVGYNVCTIKKDKYTGDKYFEFNGKKIYLT